MALALLMIMLAAVSLMVIGLARQGRMDAKLTQALVQRAEAGAIASGAAHLAMRDVLRDESAGGTPRSLPARLSYDIEGYPVTVNVSAESGLLDVSMASVELMRNAFRFVGKMDERSAQRVAAAIMDRRAARRQGFTEAGQSLQVLEDLLTLPGMDRIIYERMAPVLTVGGGGAIPDPSTAPRELLVALAGGDRNRASQWVREREAAVEQSDTASRNTARGFSLQVVVTMPDGSRLTRRISAATDAGRQTSASWRLNRLYPVVPLADDGNEGAERA